MYDDRFNDDGLYDNPNAGELATEYYVTDSRWGTSRPNGSGDPVDDEEDFDEIETPTTSLSVALSITEEPLTEYTVRAFPSRLAHPFTDWYSMPSDEELDLLSVSEIEKLINDYMQAVWGLTKLQRYHTNHAALALDFFRDTEKQIQMQQDLIRTQRASSQFRRPKIFEFQGLEVSSELAKNGSSNEQTLLKSQEFSTTRCKTFPKRKCRFSQSMLRACHKNCFPKQ